MDEVEALEQTQVPPREELLEELEVWRGLVRSRGWDRLVKILQGQINSRRGQHMVQPLESTSGITKQQFELGEAAGLEIAIRLPQNMVRDFEEQLKLLRAREGDQTYVD